MIPTISLKLAMSLDGKVATRTGESKWITGPDSRQRVMELRASHQGILTGVNTVIHDDPSLNVRDPEGRHDPQLSPSRFVLDTHGRIPSDAKLLHDSDNHNTTIIGGPHFDDTRRKEIESHGARVLNCSVNEDSGRVDPHEAAKLIFRSGVESLMIEAGGEVAASFLEAGIVSKVYFFYAPKIIGGKDAIPAVGGSGAESLQEVIQFSSWDVEQVGDDLLLTGTVSLTNDTS